MKNTWFCLIGFAGLMISTSVAAQDAFDEDSLVAGAPEPKLVSREFSFTEGPAVDKEGNIFFTDQPNDKIWKYDTDGKLSVFMDKTGRSNGLYFDRKGNIVSCADEQDQLWSIDANGKVKVLLTGFNGQKFNGPNDLWIDSKGGVYFTDPYYQRSYWTRTKPDLEKEKVYYLPKGKKEAIVVAEDIVKPNGIVGTPDGKYLYVADIQAGKIYRYSIGEKGSLSGQQLFAPQGADGMTLDERGNLYLAGRGVTVYNNSGKKIAQIPVKEGWTANLCFGGKERTTLFITASTAVYVLPMRVKGVE